MQIVKAREFRSNQGKFLNAANHGQSVLLKSRYGNFKITPVDSQDSLTERICEGLREVKRIREGKTRGYSIDELLNEL